MKMRTAALYAAIVIAAAAGVTACGGSNKPSASPPTAASPTTQPSLPEVTNQVTAVPAGRYTPKVAPASLAFEGPWTMYDNDSNYLQINKGSDFTQGVHQTLTVFQYHGKGVSPADNHSLVAAPDLLAWLQQNPHLKVTRTAAVTVGGSPGTEVDLHAVNPPDCAYYADGSKCWNLTPMIDGDPFSPDAQQAGDMLVVGSDLPGNGGGDLPTRLVLAQHGGASYVFFWVDAADSFTTSVADFETVLSTVQWQ
jgi:hypothetical protein